MNEALRREAARALLTWYRDMGVNEAVGAAPADRFAASAPDREPEPLLERRAAPAPAQPSTPVFRPGAAVPADEAIARADSAARAAPDLEALAAAVDAFDGCPLKAGARSTVVYDGVARPRLLVIGEAPGRDEDRLGRPFVGRAGQLLDRMLAAIGCSRQTDTLITNIVFWRPPGNREPSHLEIAVCRPFLDRLIALSEPRAILLAGGAPAKALLGLSGIMRTRGAWRDLEIDGRRIPALPIFHPAYLLRQPAQKRLAWSDLLSLEKKLTVG